MSKAAVSASPPPSSSYVMMFSRTSSSSSGDRESRFWRRNDNDRALTAEQRWQREKMILRHRREIGRIMNKGERGRGHRGNKGKEVEWARQKISGRQRGETQRQNKYRRSLAACMPPLCNWLNSSQTNGRFTLPWLDDSYFIFPKQTALTLVSGQRTKPQWLFDRPTRLPVISLPRKMDLVCFSPARFV